MSRARVAVIGAGGHIGRTLLARLARDPAIEVRGVCRNELTAAPLRLAGFDVRCGAISDPQAAEGLVGDCPTIVNCASATALPGTARREERAVVDGLLRLSGLRRLIHFSSVAVYGTCITAKNRFERPSPDHPFGCDKLDLERYLRARSERSSCKELVVLRMGHVYGAEQWVSRYVFDHLDKGGFRLPFDGRVPSNAIHVANVAAAVWTLVRSGQVGTLNLFDSPQSTWRAVFDWNTRAIAAPPVPALDDATSEGRREHFARISRAPNLALAREVAAWGKGLPLSLASSSQQVRFRVMRALSLLQSPRLEAHVVKRFFGGHLARMSAVAPAELACLFSIEAPGPCVAYTPEVSADDVRALVRWRDGYASPDALAPFPAPSREGRDAQAESA